MKRNRLRDWAALLFSVFLRPNLIEITPGLSFYTAYPLLPWLGIILGMTFTVLFLTGNKNGAISGFLSVYGRVPFAYFIVHLYLIHALMFAVLYLQGFGSSDFVFGLFRNGKPENGGGTGLAVVYIIWICVVLLLNPLCRWYGNYKATHRDKKWLGYL